MATPVTLRIQAALLGLGIQEATGLVLGMGLVLWELRSRGR